MIRFHFMNNEDLDNALMKLCEVYNYDSISILINQVLFQNMREFIMFINHYCHENTVFKTVVGCRVNRKVSIPDTVYHSMKLCHKELNTYSIALIWRSLLLDIIECFTIGGLDEWNEFKRSVIEKGIMREKKTRKDNRILLNHINSVHIPGTSWQNISKIGFYESVKLTV